MFRVAPARWVVLGAALTIAGLAVSATAPIAGTEGAEHMQTQQSAGGLAMFVGWIVLAWGIHRFGRERPG